MGARICLISLGLLALLVSTGCVSGGEKWRVSWSAPYSDFDRPLREEFYHSRALMNTGEIHEAYRAFERLCAGAPSNIELGLWKQEVERELLLEGRSPWTGERLAGRSIEGVMEERYAGLLRSQRSAEDTLTPDLVAAHVLAARVSTDPEHALTLLESALELDSQCAFAYYAQAHTFLGQRLRVDRWRLAKSSLDRALSLDPSLLRARKLEIWMLSNEGRLTEAALRLEAWLSRTLEDSRVSSHERIDAEIDLALLWVLLDRADRAATLLDSLGGTTHSRERRLAVYAVALHQTGDKEAALQAARRAEDAQPDSLLPVVQQALLLQQMAHSDLAPETVALERERWDRVVQLANQSGELADLLQLVRAQVNLEQIDGSGGGGGAGQGQR